MKKVALDLLAKEGFYIATFECPFPGPDYALGVSVLVPIKSGKMVPKATLKYAQTGGKQKPEEFEGLGKDVLTLALGGPAKQAGLTLTTIELNEEKIEANWFV
jgi:hypothetical protein